VDLKSLKESTGKLEGLVGPLKSTGLRELLDEIRALENYITSKVRVVVEATSKTASLAPSNSTDIFGLFSAQGLRRSLASRTWIRAVFWWRP